MMHHKMAQIIHTPTYSYLAILVFTTLTLLIAPTLSTTLQNGFILELIHRFSIHSPSYSPNLTFIEKIERLVEISDNRVEWIESSLRADRMESGSLMGIRPIVTHDRGVYMVKIGIGKPPTNVHLLLDSGSSLVWTQCAPCVHCFPQDPPMYNPAFSDTYRPLPCIHPFCTGLPCINNMCRFVLRYEDNTYTKGIMAAEQFTFASNVGEMESVGGAFGCSSESSPNMFPSTRAVSGILGIGAGPASFLSQLGRLARGRFSYCLVPMDLPSAGASYLRFGADTERIKNGRATPMLRSFDRTHYFVELQAISVDGRRLHLPPGTFARRPDGTGGCLVDSGTSATFLTEIAYTAVCNAIDAFFAGRNLTRIGGTRLGLDLCYRMRRGFASYPSVEFQLKGVNLRPRPANVFLINKKSSFFCLYMRKKKGMTVLGSALQQNYRVVYDTRRNKITFAEENCARDQKGAT